LLRCVAEPRIVRGGVGRHACVWLSLPPRACQTQQSFVE
jgi:hypothetical protein